MLNYFTTKNRPLKSGKFSLYFSTNIIVDYKLVRISRCYDFKHTSKNMYMSHRLTAFLQSTLHTITGIQFTPYRRRLICEGSRYASRWRAIFCHTFLCNFYLFGATVKNVLGSSCFFESSGDTIKFNLHKSSFTHLLWFSINSWFVFSVKQVPRHLNPGWAQKCRL